VIHARDLPAPATVEETAPNKSRRSNRTEANAPKQQRGRNAAEETEELGRAG